MTSVYDIRDENHTITKYAIVLLFITLLLYGTIINLLMTADFWIRKNIYSRAFILISLQLIISDFMAFLPDVTIVLPEILQTGNISESKLSY